MPNLDLREPLHGPADDLLYRAMGLPFAQAANTSAMGLALVNQESQVIWTNPAFARLICFHRSPVGAQLDHALDLQFRLADGEAVHALSQSSGSTLELHCGRQASAVMLHIAALDGDTRVVVAVGAATAPGNEVDTGFSEEMTDPLTRLGNRKQLMAKLAERDDQTDLAVLCIDIDQFVEVNESLGRADGDRLLQLVADRLTRASRPGDQVLRTDGDEFMVLHSIDDGPASAIAMAERLRGIFDRPFRLDDHLVQLGASVGVALAHTELPVDTEELLWRVATALRDAQRAGGQCMSLFEPLD